MREQDVQGYWGPFPYDFRRPTWARIKARMWNHEAGMFTPHFYGMGWTLNMAHRGSQLLIAGLVIGLTLALAVF